MKAFKSKGGDFLRHINDELYLIALQVSCLTTFVSMLVPSLLLLFYNTVFLISHGYEKNYSHQSIKMCFRFPLLMFLVQVPFSAPVVQHLSKNDLKQAFTLGNLRCKILLMSANF